MQAGGWARTLFRLGRSLKRGNCITLLATKVLRRLSKNLHLLGKVAKLSCSSVPCAKQRKWDAAWRREKNLEVCGRPGISRRPTMRRLPRKRKARFFRPETNLWKEEDERGIGSLFVDYSRSRRSSQVRRAIARQNTCTGKMFLQPGIIDLLGKKAMGQPGEVNANSNWVKPVGETENSNQPRKSGAIWWWVETTVKQD